MVIENSKDFMRATKKKGHYEIYVSREGIGKIIKPSDVSERIFKYNSLETTVDSEDKENLRLTCSSTSYVADVVKKGAIFEMHNNGKNSQIPIVTVFPKMLYYLSPQEDDEEEKIESIPFYDSKVKKKGEIYLLDNFPDKFSDNDNSLNLIK